MHMEQQQPAAQRWRHAELLASQANGALSRKSGMFRASEFVADPWAEPPPAAAAQPSAATIAAQIAAINARME